MMMEIQNLHVAIGETEILHGIDLVIPDGEVHAIMGPNGSGKSTLASTLMGHPNFSVTAGSVQYHDQDILTLTPDERSKLGLFLSFQYPQEIAGVSIGNFMRLAMNARATAPLDIPALYHELTIAGEQIGIPEAMLTRGVNEGFSGGEKKRLEMLQMMILKPSFAILDETDSGLDIDALKAVATAVNAMRSPARSFLIITHYQRLLEFITPDKVHVLIDGKITRSGGPEVAKELELSGYGK
jgi:Fe-S cluster assembly ATP-binding protein